MLQETSRDCNRQQGRTVVHLQRSSALVTVLEVVLVPVASEDLEKTHRMEDQMEPLATFQEEASCRGRPGTFERTAEECFAVPEELLASEAEVLSR